MAPSKENISFPLLRLVLHILTTYQHSMLGKATHFMRFINGFSLYQMKGCHFQQFLRIQKIFFKNFAPLAYLENFSSEK